MGNLTSTPIMVYEQTADWNFTRNQKGGVTAQRKFLETDTVLSSSTKVPLPKIGDFWDVNNTEVVAKQVVTTFLCFNTYMHTISYDALINTQLPALLTPDLSPTGLDIGNELISWLPEDPDKTVGTNWKWEEDNTTLPKNQSLYKFIGEGNIRKQRVVSNIRSYSTLVFSKVGKVNGSSFLGFAKGNVLFEGINTTMSQDRIGQPIWTIDLNFKARVIDDSDNSWQKLLRQQDGLFRTPISPDGNKIYETTNFNPLFSSNPLGSAENLFSVPPRK